MRPYTVVGWWDNDGGGDYIGHVRADNVEAAKATALIESGASTDGENWDLVIIAVFDGHLTEAQ